MHRIKKLRWRKTGSLHLSTRSIHFTAAVMSAGNWFIAFPVKVRSGSLRFVSAPAGSVLLLWNWASIIMISALKAARQISAMNTKCTDQRFV